MHRSALIFAMLSSLVVSACADGHEGRLLETRRVALLGASDSVMGSQGPLVSGIASSSEVWEVTRQWDDVSTEAGLAWAAHSGLDWNGKYAAWVSSFSPTASEDGHTTFMLTTPWGKSLPAPRLECAETAIFLRVTFAAWHGLPMYMGAYSPSHGGNIYFGHFGIIQHSGARVPGFPKFKSAYADYTESHGQMSAAALQAAWPSSSSLALKSLGASYEDDVSFLGAEAYAGAYFDAIYLNKRDGEFLMRALTNLGSMHIVDDAINTFNLEPSAMEPGDLMMQRWQKQGIGHTVVLLDVAMPGPNARDIEVAYGSMPRIQPKVKSGGAAESFLTAQKSGGPGLNSEGIAYAALGGGLKRFRSAVISSGRWRNVVPSSDADVWVNAGDLDALAERPAALAALFDGPDASEEREILLGEIADARAALRARPSSCTQRSRREAAFVSLYALQDGWFDVGVEATDRAYRILDDYVFAELDYAASKTCCWNATTPAMYDLIMDFNLAHTWDAGAQACYPPVVFKAGAQGYTPFADYAEDMGYAHLWSDWQADESCPQAALPLDTESAHVWTPMCEIADAILDMSDPEPETSSGDDEESTSVDADAVIDTVGGGWKCGASSEAPLSSWFLMLLVIASVALRREHGVAP